METGRTIDLDRDRPVAGSSAGSWARSLPWHQAAPAGSSGTAAALVVLLALVLLGGAQAPPRPALVALVGVPARAPTAMLLTAGHLFVGEEAGFVAEAGGARGSTVSAYGLSAGGARWRSRLAGRVDGLRWVGEASVLLASTYDSRLGGHRLAALDGSTGDVLWADVPADVVDQPPGGRVLLRGVAAQGSTDLRWVEDRTGQVLWSRTLAARTDVAAAHAAAAGPGALLVTDVNGSAELLAEDTGARLAAGELGSLVGNLVLTPGPPAAAPNPAPERAAVNPLGGEFLVQRRRNAGSASLTAFDAAALTRRWTITGDLLGVPIRCGTLLCLGASGGMRAVDPVTGALRWSTPRWQYASSLGGDRLIGYALAHTANELGVLDAGTGRTLLDLGGAWARVYLDGAPPTLLGRPDPTRPDRYWFALLDAERLTVRPLGALTGVHGQSCRPYRALLACHTLDGRVRVWRHAT